eukprot:256580-Lingulodinium_polyedra.AAC.1
MHDHRIQQVLVSTPTHVQAPHVHRACRKALHLGRQVALALRAREEVQHQVPCRQRGKSLRFLQRPLLPSGQALHPTGPVGRIELGADPHGQQQE